MRHVSRLSMWTFMVVVGGSGWGVAHAQAPPEPRFEAFVAAGPGWMWSDESYLGTGVVAGAGIGYRRRSLGLELLVDHRRNSPDFGNDVVFKAQRTRVAGRLLYFMSRGSAQPYVGGAVGYSRVRSSSDFPDDCEFVDHQLVCRSRLRFSSTDRERVLSAVAGVRLAFGDRWFLRPEFEFGMPGEGVMMSATVALGRGW